MSGPALVLSVTDSRSRMAHLVAVETAALHRRSGRYPALCETEVISASMLTESVRECQDCQTRAGTGAGADRWQMGAGWRRSGRPGRRRRPDHREGGRVDE